MKVYYEQLSAGDFPIFSRAKSKSVHIWIPRSWPKKLSGGHGWVRQSDPVPNGRSLSDHNCLIPLMRVNRARFSRWLTARIRQLGARRGHVVVVIYCLYEDALICGVYHDTRPAPEGMPHNPPAEDKGKPLASRGLDLWTLEGPDVKIYVEGNPDRGWQARLGYASERHPHHESLLRARILPVYGKDLDRVIDVILREERARIQRARLSLDAKEQALDLLAV